jgi:hypothetical protein
MCAFGADHNSVIGKLLFQNIENTFLVQVVSKRALQL